MTIKPGKHWDDTSSSTEPCAADIGNWVDRNRVILEHSKKELILFSFKQHVMEAENLRFRIDSGYIKASSVHLYKPAYDDTQ